MPHSHPGAARSVTRFINVVLCQALRVLPRRRRFGAVVRSVELFQPLLRRTPSFRLLLKMFPVNAEREVAVRLLLGGFIRSKTAFDPPFVVHGEELIDRSLAGERGMLVVGAHNVLDTLVMRYLHDRGRLPAVVATEQMYVDGTRVSIPLILHGGTFLVRVRTLLNAGETVCAMLDHGRSSRRTRAMALKSAVINVSNGLLRVAIRCEAWVVFVATRVGHDRRVHIYFAGPSKEATTPEAIAQEFGDFLHSLDERPAAVEM